MIRRRQFYAGRHVQRALSIAELRAMARKRVPPVAFEYVDCGAEDEVTLRWNRSVFETLRVVPRTFVDTRARHAQIDLFGREASLPLIMAPTAMNGMLRHRGDQKRFDPEVYYQALSNHRSKLTPLPQTTRVSKN